MPGVAGRSAREVSFSAQLLARRARLRRRLGLGCAGASAAMAFGLFVTGSVLWILAAAATLLLLALAGRARPDPDPERWGRGALGEEATAVLLDRLSPRRWVVLHDRRLPGARANVDHLVIGPTGVWVLDSKAFRARLRARRHGVDAGSHRLDTGPVAWEAEVVADLLGVETTPLVVVHGVGLPDRGRRVGGVRVVPAGVAVARLRRRRGRRRLRLAGAEVARLAALAEAALPEA